MLTQKELVIMECLWRKAIPLSCIEIEQSSDMNWNRKSLYEILKNLQKKNMIHIIGTRKNNEIKNRKPIQLYETAITNVEYMESLITSNPIYNNDLLPFLFQGLIGRVVKKETLDQLREIVEKARRDL